MPGFPKVLHAIADAYSNRRADIDRSGRDLVDRMRATDELGSGAGQLPPEILDTALGALSGQFDAANGGFGTAPKFPQPMALEFLLRSYARTREHRALAMMESSLRHMAEGGIYDHLGGGFHRYSTDAHWLVPHFEKMLYDNAQLARVYLSSFQVTGDSRYRTVCEETLDYVLREMTNAEGGFYSTQDADSEGIEGKYFSWTRNEVLEALGPERALLFCTRYGVHEAGNFEGKNVLHISASIADAAQAAAIGVEHAEADLAESRAMLFAVRELRVHPGLDDKVVTSWNGLMLRAFAEASRVLERDDYRSAAIRNAEFIRANMWRDGRLQRVWREGTAKGDAYLEDYACLSNGLLSLYEATFNWRWFQWARDLARVMVEHFGDVNQGGFYDTAVDHEALVLRPKEVFDNAMPSGNSAAAEALLRLAAFTGDSDYEQRALSVLRLVAPLASRYPTGFGNLLCSIDRYQSESKQIAIVGHQNGSDTQALARAVFGSYLPNVVIAGSEPNDLDAAQAVPLLEGRIGVSEDPLVYVCEHFACQMPTGDPQAVARMLGIPGD